MFTLNAKNTFDGLVPFRRAQRQHGARRTNSFTPALPTAFAEQSIGNIPDVRGAAGDASFRIRRYTRRNGWIREPRGYALSRVAITRSSAGRRQVNVSSSRQSRAGALGERVLQPAAAPAAATLSRWGSQVMWTPRATELKEFWPRHPRVASARHRTATEPLHLASYDVIYAR